MILKREFLNNMLAMRALDKLTQSNKIPGGTAYRIGRLHQGIHREIVITRDLWQKLLQKYALSDEKNEPIFENGNPKFADKENEKAHDAAFNELMNEEFEIRVHPIPFRDIEDSGLNSQELISLEALLTGLPDEQPGGDGPIPTQPQKTTSLPSPEAH